jgi:RNA polymerase sigma factor (sigma-70 family)
MTQSSQALLLKVLMNDYGILKGRLARRLGSADVADDVLQEAYLRVSRMPAMAAVLHPRTYLFRIALNIAADRRRSEKRRLARSEVELLLRLDQDDLDPERIAQARSSVRALELALEELAPRRRAIFVAVRVNGLTVPEVAARFGLSTRYIERELKDALDHCRGRLEMEVSQTFGPRPSAASKE